MADSAARSAGTDGRSLKSDSSAGRWPLIIDSAWFVIARQIFRFGFSIQAISLTPGAVREFSICSTPFFFFFFASSS
jgi:hypothetical protein